MSITRVLVGQASTLTMTAYSSGDQTDLGTFTIGIVDANGDTVVTSGTAVTDNGDGTYQYSLAAQTEPNLLTITWTEAAGTTLVTYVEVVGSILFDEAALRTFDDDAISSTTDYTDADILAMHDRVADYLEHATGRSWIRRYARCIAAGTGSNNLYLDEAIFRTAAGLPLDRPGATRDIVAIISASDGTAITKTNVLPFGDRLVRTDAAWTAPSITNPYNVTLEYEYGLPYSVDGVDRIAMLIARHWLVASRIPGNAASFTDTLGSYTFDETKLPFEAYQWIKSHRAHAFFA